MSAITEFGLEFFENLEFADREELIYEIIPEEYQNIVWKNMMFQDDVPVLFRGVRNSLGDVVVSSSPKYKMDKSGVQNSLVLFFDYFMKKAGFQATPTNSIFCTRSMYTANEYRYDMNTRLAPDDSTIYLVFPLQKNDYTFSLKVNDYINLYSEFGLFHLRPWPPSESLIEDMWDRIRYYMWLPDWVANGAAEIYTNKEMLDAYIDHLGGRIEFENTTNSTFTLFHVWYVLLKYFNEIPKGLFHKRYRSGNQVFQDLAPQIGQFLTKKLEYTHDVNKLSDMMNDHEVMVKGKVLMISLEYIAKVLFRDR